MSFAKNECQQLTLEDSMFSLTAPNTPVNVIVGGMVLEELMGLTDEEFMDSLLFDIRFQYALHTTSFKEQPVSDRTFSRFRRRCLTYETELTMDIFLSQDIYIIEGVFAMYHRRECS